ncbi:zinc-ribbon domain-containing protein [Faecalicatena acetigenes]|uniref:Zinc-ribbon domain-containing protein n=1 Tax=Faecalicatena acetigenes TaxID=2981790 RepID=A0ABT2TBS3_9FIRM|nr:MULTISPECIES: zinc-ribbon domain-containing protein [Lachnospiraceae]MCU6747661.1 zinc-ribbon domain-containing protein [Faecalicatena acetigenes]SCI02641.1 Lectin C-type domain [uncultured Clostridium sp.]
MRCPKCNSPVNEGDVFCEKCGAPLAKKKKSKLPAVIVSLVLILGILAGICVWIVTDEYHVKDSKEELSARIEEYKGAPDADKKTTKDSGKEEEDPEDEDKKDLKEADEDKNKKEPAEEKKVYDPEEGGVHRYELFISDCTWSEAYQYCLNAGGYLARINSKEEYDMILSEILRLNMQDIQFRIGGRRNPGSEEYYWVNEKNELYGEQINTDTYWCANEWMDNEPSFKDGTTEEDCLDIFYYQGSGEWVFNDVPNDILGVAPDFSGKIGYICEYED